MYVYGFQNRMKLCREVHSEHDSCIKFTAQRWSKNEFMNLTLQTCVVGAMIQNFQSLLGCADCLFYLRCMENMDDVE